MKWHSEQYWLKSKLYQERATEVGRDEAERAFWRSLALEHLLRSALTKIHPALNADPQNEGLNLLHAFGFEIKGEPRAIPVHAVTARLERVLDGFKKPQREFCDYMMLMRNEEVHTSESPFAAMKEAQWLPRYYEVCAVLNGFMEVPLESYLGTDEAETASRMIAARNSARQADIARRIAEHRGVFERKDPDDRAALAAAQAAAATVWHAPTTSTKCPACGSIARVDGAIEGTGEPIFRDGAFVVERRFLASSLTCGACALELRDIEELLLAEVEPHYTLVAHTDLHDFFQPDDLDGYMNM